MKQSHGLSADKIRILIVGVGALGGTIAARALYAGVSVFMAARDEQVARSLRFSGLEVSGLGELVDHRLGPEILQIGQWNPASNRQSTSRTRGEH